VSEERGIVEAALFSAGKPVTPEDIAESTKLPVEQVISSLKGIRKAYDSMKSALEVTQIGKKWTIQIRSEYTEKARYFAPPELPEDVVKTAALIAYHQPIRQSDLGDMIGEKVYDHVKMLRGLNLVSARPEGRTLSLTTSRQFPDFFGLKATARKEIKKFMGERAGLKKEETPSIETETHD